jgi:hypothetical protein
MAGPVVHRVATRRQKKAFLQFPWSLYRDDPNWIPPLRLDQKEMVGYRPHPFYKNNAAQTFLAYRSGGVCGRIAAILNRDHNHRYAERRGFFGFFECVDDQQVANALFDAVREWFAEQDVHLLRGPTNPSLNYTLGLLVKGFDSPPTFMMTYNPPYYPQLVEQCGFEKTQDMYAFWGHIDMLKTIDAKVHYIADEAKRRFDVRLRNLDRSRFEEDVRLFLDVYNRSLVGTWGFAPMSEGEIRHLSASLKYLIVPELTAAAEIQGRVVGVVLGLLDYNPRIKSINGRLFPFGFLRLLANKRAISRVRLVSTNVVPEYQKWGIGLVLLRKLLPDVLAFGIQEAEFSWVLESNHLSYATLKRGGAEITKTYRIYDSPIRN